MTANNPDSVETGQPGESAAGSTPAQTQQRDSETTGAVASDAVGDSNLDQAARAELLAEENRRLRSEYARAQQAKYRTTAYALGVVGLLAVVGGVLFPAGREVLFVLGGTGIFGGILTLYLTPGEFVAADVGERVYAAMAANETAIAEELGLSETRVYVPESEHAARLYIPQRSEFEIPTEEDGPVIVSEASRGLLLDATGSYLFDEFEQALTGELAETPTTLAEQLADGVVEQFELASAVEPDVDTEDGRITFEVSGSAFGDLDRVDHPIVSFLAVAVAVARQQPVQVEVTPDDEDWLVTCRWETEDSE